MSFVALYPRPAESVVGYFPLPFFKVANYRRVNQFSKNRNFLPTTIPQTAFVAESFGSYLWLLPANAAVGMRRMSDDEVPKRYKHLRVNRTNAK